MEPGIEATGCACELLYVLESTSLPASQVCSSTAERYQQNLYPHFDWGDKDSIYTETKLTAAGSELCRFLFAVSSLYFYLPLFFWFYRLETEQLKTEKVQLVNQLNQYDIDSDELKKR